MGAARLDRIDQGRIDQRQAAPLDEGHRQVDSVGLAYRLHQPRQKRVGRTARGQELTQAASVLRSSVFSQRSASRPGRRSPVVQVSTGSRPET